jgi:aspartate/methionine/tyrosine aminotransferase
MEPENYRKIVKIGKTVGATNLIFLKKWVSDRKELTWVEPKASFCSFPRYDFDLSSWDFCDRALKEQQVLLGPGSGFMIEGYIRLGFGSYPERFRESLQKFDNFLISLKQEKV